MTKTEQYTIQRRWSWLTALTVTIECDPATPGPIKLGLAVKMAFQSGAVLRDAVLRGAVLRGADLSDAVLSGAPKIENIHQVVYEAASALGALDMTKWHCGTSHCRAGWVVTLAGDEGRALEERIGTPAAASLIYLASDPDLGKFPDFYCTNATALADMKARAEAEADRATGKS